MAVRWDPKYLKRGLAGICVKALDDDHVDRQALSRDRARGRISQGDDLMSDSQGR